MRKPQKPPEINRTWSDYLDPYHALLTKLNIGGPESEELRRLIHRYNEEEYIHWDDLRRKKLPCDSIPFWFLIRSFRNAHS